VDGPTEPVPRRRGDDLAPGRALDLACGEGRYAVWLARQGWEVLDGPEDVVAALPGLVVDKAA
jgi:2-polyprenyl-3-methyl-5-hydroxy-6-metoxy-1,4-benzoquinol methylase